MTDKEIMEARNLLAKSEGIFAEQAGAAALAGVLRYKKKIEENSKVVCLVTGHGLKEPTTAVRGEVKEVRAHTNVLGKIFR